METRDEDAEMMESLRHTQQHLVFQDSKSRADTSELIKSKFNLNEIGRQRIDFLLKHKYDREIVGHLVGMLMSRISSLENETKCLKAEMFCMFLKHKESEAEVKELKQENDELQANIKTLSDTLERTGLKSALENCNLLSKAIGLLKDNANFEHIEAAVQCFSYTPEQDNKCTVDVHTRSEQVDSPVSCSHEEMEKNKRVKHQHNEHQPFDTGELLPPPVLTPSPEVLMYHRLLYQQQVYRQKLLEMNVDS